MQVEARKLVHPLAPGEVFEPREVLKEIEGIIGVIPFVFHFLETFCLTSTKTNCLSRENGKKRGMEDEKESEAFPIAAIHIKNKILKSTTNSIYLTTSRK